MSGRRFWTGLLLLVLAAPLNGQIELVREQIFRRLERAHKLFEESKYQESLAILQTLDGMSLNTAEEGQSQQLVGFNLLSLQRYREAIIAFDRAVASGALPAPVQRSIRRDLISLEAQEENWEECLRRLQEFLPDETDPSVELFATGATAASQLKRYELALQYILEAIRRSPEPREPFYQSWAAYLFELDRFPQLAQVLEIMVRLFPDREPYWRQLGGLYLQLKEDRKALAAFALAHQRGFLRTENEVLTLANLYMFMEEPFRSATIIQQGMDSEIVARSFKNLENLANAWTAARENDQAIAALEAAASLDDVGETYYRLGQLHVEAEDWPSAIRDLRAALDKGSLRQEHQAYILLGYALYSSGDLEGAIATFERARDFPATARTADQWLVHLREELAAKQADTAAEAARQSAAAAPEPTEQN